MLCMHPASSIHGSALNLKAMGQSVQTLLGDRRLSHWGLQHDWQQSERLNISTREIVGWGRQAGYKWSDEGIELSESLGSGGMPHLHNCQVQMESRSG